MAFLSGEQKFVTSFFPFNWIIVKASMIMMMMLITAMMMLMIAMMMMMMITKLQQFALLNNMSNLLMNGVFNLNAMRILHVLSKMIKISVDVKNSITFTI